MTAHDGHWWAATTILLVDWVRPEKATPPESVTVRPPAPVKALPAACAGDGA